MFFASREAFDETGNLMKKDKQLPAISHRHAVQHILFESINVYLLLRCLCLTNRHKENQRSSLNIHAQSQFA